MSTLNQEMSESPTMGKVRAIPKLSGLHHYYTRRAAESDLLGGYCQVEVSSSKRTAR